MMVRLLVYAHCTGISSSPSIERAICQDVAIGIRSANQQPDHATIAESLPRHRDAPAALLLQALGLRRPAGLEQLGT